MFECPRFEWARSLLLVLALLAVASGVVMRAQQSAPPAPAASDQMPVFRVQTRLVQVPVVVTDASGKPVTGLKFTDFEILQDRAAQKIAFFTEEQTTAERVQYKQPQPSVYDNQVTGASAGKRLTILVLDTVNTTFQDQAYARTELLKFLAREVNGTEPVALLTIDRTGTHVIHDFTQDPAALATALKRVSGQLPAFDGDTLGESKELRAFQNIRQSEIITDRIQITLQALQHIAQAFAVIPGRKSLIWVTGGIPFGNEEPVALNRMGGRDWQPPTAGKDMRLLYRRTFQELNQANMAVYPVDPAGVTGTHFVGGNNDRAGMQILADMTGGRSFYESNNLAGLFQKAADDCSSYYMLGYYLPPDLEPGWHQLRVKVRGKGLTARARSGFFTLAPPKDEKDATERRRLEVGMALVSPLNYTALPIAARWVGSATASTGAKRAAKFQVTLAPDGVYADEEHNNAVSLEVVAVVRDAQGKDVDHFAQHIEANLKPETLARLRRDGLNYVNSVTVPPGEYQVRFVIRDNLTGRTGSVLAPLKVM